MVWKDRKSKCASMAKIPFSIDPKIDCVPNSLSTIPNVACRGNGPTKHSNCIVESRSTLNKSRALKMQFLSL